MILYVWETCKNMGPKGIQAIAGYMPSGSWPGASKGRREIHKKIRRAVIW